MYYVYCLQHQGNKELYYGYTEDLGRRLKEHQKKDRRWKLIYYEAYFCKTDATRMEKKLKDYGQARARLKYRLKDSLSK